MAWGMVIAAAFSALSSRGGRNAARRAADQQAGMSEAGILEQRRQFEAIQQLLNPYVSAGTGALSALYETLGLGSIPSQTPLTDAISASDGGRDEILWRMAEANTPLSATRFGTPEDQAAQRQSRIQAEYDRLVTEQGGAITGQQQTGLRPSNLSADELQRRRIAAIEASPMFTSLIGQGEEAILSNASATGGLRGGNTQAALSRFRPQLLNTVIQQQLDRYASLASIGQNAAAGVGNAGMSSANSIADLLAQGGAARAGGILAAAESDRQMYNTFAGLAGNYFGRNNRGDGGNETWQF